MKDVNEKKLAQALANVEAFGVAAIKVSDGEVFIFKRDRLVKLLESIDASKSATGAIFVKTGKSEALPDA